MQTLTLAEAAAFLKMHPEEVRSRDLRHTWSSWHVQTSMPLQVLQELGGWASYAMVHDYADLAADHSASRAERLTSSSHEILIWAGVN